MIDTPSVLIGFVVGAAWSLYYSWSLHCVSRRVEQLEEHAAEHCETCQRIHSEQAHWERAQ